MKPTKEYNGRSRIRMYNVDCMGFMKQCGEYDLAIVDPPYGIGVSSEGKMTSTSKKEYDKKNWDDNTPTIEYFKELKRVAKHQIIWGANFFDGMGLIGGGIVWNKLGKNIGRRMPIPKLSDCEYAYCSKRNNIKMFSYTQIGNVYGNNYQINWNQERIHPTQKPIALYEWLLKNYATEGDTILDTHGGSMSLAIACWNMGFDLDICELDKDYFKDAVKRFENHIKRHKNDLFPKLKSKEIKKQKPLF